ncbi:MAG TPA: hypothetical protein VH092_30315 [Urbifossiella sp.]|jgi:hypothetical protein|nr:hypothetical protein [Urbifossiella sp.]
MPKDLNPKRCRLPKVVDDGFVIHDVDGFAQLTPEQKLWPVDPAIRETDVPPITVPTGYEAVCEEVVPGDPRLGVRWSARPSTMPLPMREPPMTDAAPVVRDFLLCHHVRYDPTIPRAPYSIENVLFRHRLSDDESFPLVVDELWFFTRIEGSDSHDIWIDVSPVPEEGGDPADVLASYGPFPDHLGRTRVGKSRGWRLRGVPFPHPGMYTFRLLVAGEVLAQQHVYLED